MSDEEPFLAAIYADPDDDAPRLVFADWLDEHGQPERAEFIRLQCRIAAGGPYTDVDDTRQDSLSDRYETEWTRHLPQEKWAIWRFRRGMPEELEIDGQLLLQQYGRWATLTRVRHLLVYELNDGMLSEFASRTWNPSWCVLRVGESPKPWFHPQGPGEIMHFGTRALVSTPQVGRLRELWFDYVYDLGDRSITAICESPHLDGLRVLGVPQSAITDPRLVARFGDRLRKTW